MVLDGIPSISGVSGGEQTKGEIDGQFRAVSFR